MMNTRSFRFHKILFFCLCALVIFAIIPHQSFAQTTCSDPSECSGTSGVGQSAAFVPLASYKNSTLFTNAFSSTGSLPQYINNVFTIALSVGAILAVLRIAYAGYMYMGSADMWGNKERAREMIGDAIVGLLLLFAIYLILNQIDPNILNLNILQDLPAASATPATTCQSANCTGVYDSSGITSQNAGGVIQQIDTYQTTGYGGN